MNEEMRDRQEQERNYTATMERKSWPRLLVLAFFMALILIVGATAHRLQFAGVSNWFGRSGLLLVGLSIMCDYADRASGWFTSVTSDTFWSEDDKPRRKRFATLIFFGLFFGTLISAFGDLWMV